MAGKRSLEGMTEYPHDLDAVLELGIHLADSLAIVHAQTPQIVHRDLKPANLLQMTMGVCRSRTSASRI